MFDDITYDDLLKKYTDLSNDYYKLKTKYNKLYDKFIDFKSKSKFIKHDNIVEVNIENCSFDDIIDIISYVVRR